SCLWRLPPLCLLRRISLPALRNRLRRPLRFPTSLTQRPPILAKPALAPLPRRIPKLQHNPQATVHAPQDLQRLAHSITPDRSQAQKTRKYKSKRLTERTFEVAHIANV